VESEEKIDFLFFRRQAFLSCGASRKIKKREEKEAWVQATVFLFISIAKQMTAFESDSFGGAEDPQAPTGTPDGDAALGGSHPGHPGPAGDPRAGRARWADGTGREECPSVE